MTFSSYPRSFKPSPEDEKKQLAKEARIHIAEAKAMIALLENAPDHAIMVKVGGIKMGLCNNEAFIRVLKSEISEAKKAIEGKENKFE